MVRVKFESLGTIYVYIYQYIFNFSAVEYSFYRVFYFYRPVQSRHAMLQPSGLTQCFLFSWMSYCSCGLCFNPHSVRPVLSPSLLLLLY